MKYRINIAPHWQDLGMQLLPEKYTDKINVIKADHDNKVEDCCHEMFQYWLQVDTEANWKKLIDALEHIQQNAIAAKVKKDNLIGNTAVIIINTE